MKGLLIAIFLYVALPLAAEVSIRAEIDRQGGYENSPISGLIMIGHSADEEVDKSRFLLDNASLPVELVKQERLGSNKLISIFRFSLPPQPKGAYLLQPITALVGGRTYRSIASTYEVMAANRAPAVTAPVAAPSTAPAAASASTAAVVAEGEAPSLILQSFVDGPEELFPGQKTRVGYKYIYNANIDTTKEEVPLLQAAGLIKVGEQIAKESQQGNLTTLEISQIIQGDAPGAYTFGPSILEGIPYQMDTSGRKSYAKQKLTSTVKPVTITVKPFPAEEKPLSFTGAVGQFQWDAALLSNPQIQVGDRVSLALTVQGTGDMQNIALPDLCCQPGVSGLFRMSDLPPVGKVEGDKKIFTVEMRALSSALQEVPSFELSSFDPQSGKYVLYHTKPIPIQITAPEEKAVTLPPVEASDSPSSQWQNQLNQVEKIDIEGYDELHTQDLHNLFFGTWWALFLIPFGIGFLMFQSNLAEYLAKEKLQPKAVVGKELFAAGEKATAGSLEQYALWEKAFMLRLYETGWIDQPHLRLENLSTEGITGQVRTFLLAMQKERYSGMANKAGDHTSRQQDAKILFNQIEPRSVS